MQRHQLAQLERLRRFGYPVEVIRAEWTVDPEQEYVVVDVETTGGNAKRNRVTEIGAIKVRGGVIIDEWTTLLNPERSIPKRIVELTGITDEMVKAAPLFPDVADEFREFLGDSVFVAHRAAFDFGFLRAEFQRIEQDLQCPT
ncbi:3'-5' exonuclease, partial [bacterium]|nr:3'-5' exonuclease [bacterium]